MGFGGGGGIRFRDRKVGGWGGYNAIETVGKWITAESLGSQGPKEMIRGGKRSQAAFRGANLVPECSICYFFSTCTTNQERLLKVKTGADLVERFISWSVTAVPPSRCNLKPRGADTSASSSLAPGRAWWGDAGNQLDLPLSSAGHLQC